MQLPSEPPTLRVVTRPNDANPNGDIFGGWLMSHADVAGAIEAVKIAGGAVVTRAVKDFQFIKPLYVGDLVSFYTSVSAIGNTSVTINVNIFSQSQFAFNEDSEKVGVATLIYVAVSKPGIKRIIVNSGNAKNKDGH